MSKYSKEELLKKLNERLTDEDLKIEFLEDITDSFPDEVIPDSTKELEELKATYEDLVEKYNELLEKYKSRFLSKEDVDKTEEEAREEEIYRTKIEDNIIDIKEI